MGVASDSVEHYLMADDTMGGIVREGIRDVCLQLNHSASREGVPFLPAHESRAMSNGRNNYDGQDTYLLLYNHPRATKVPNTGSA